MNRFKTLILRGIAAAAVGAAVPAHAGVVSVDAALNSRSGGSGVLALELVQGQQFQLSASALDTWSAGALSGGLERIDPALRDTRDARISAQTRANADGLTSTLLAQSRDDSGATAGTVIGRDFGLYDDGSFAAPYAALVGRIGEGDYFLVGTSYSGIAARSGTLKLYFWDANAFDNAGQVRVDVADIAGAVPEPASAALVAVALGALGVSRRRRARA